MQCSRLQCRAEAGFLFPRRKGRHSTSKMEILCRRSWYRSSGDTKDPCKRKPDYCSLPTRNFKTIFLNGTGFSTYGAWPQFLITTSSLLGISSYSLAYCNGIILSCSPHTRRVGAIILVSLPFSLGAYLMPSTVDINAYFALVSLILFTKSITISSLTAYSES